MSIISFFRILIVRISSLFYFSRRSKVIFYHDIHSNTKYTNMSTPVDLFKKHVQMIRESGYEIVSEITQLKGQIEISFDDAFLGLYDNIELIKELNIPIRLFVISSYLDKKGHINRQQLVELHQLPQITIAAHTHSHKSLNKMDLDEIQFELKKSKEELEKILTSKVDSICFPEGKFNRDSVLLSEGEGYIKIYSSLPGFYYDDFIGVKKRSLVQFAQDREFKAILKGGDHFLFFWYKRKHYNK